jgi:hypothetical protein
MTYALSTANAYSTAGPSAEFQYQRLSEDATSSVEDACEPFLVTAQGFS